MFDKMSKKAFGMGGLCLLRVACCVLRAACYTSSVCRVKREILHIHTQAVNTC